MSENRIDIEVNVDSKEAEKGLKRLEGTSKAVGESFGVVGSSFSKMGGEMNQNIGVVGESLSGLTGSLSTLTETAKLGSISFSALLGPIGAVVLGIIELHKAIKQYSGETRESEIRIEGYRASVSEMTAAIEELAAAQVVLNEAQIDELEALTMKAKIPIEESQEIRQRNATRVEEIFQIDRKIKKLKEEQEEQRELTRYSIQTAETSMVTNARIDQLLKKRERLASRVEVSRKKSIELLYEGSAGFAEFEAKKIEHLETSLKFREEQLKKEVELVRQAELQILALRADNLEGQKKLLEAQMRIRVENLEAMFQKGKISRKAGYKILEGIEAQHQLNIRKAEEADRQKRLAKYRTFQAKKLAELRKAQAEEARIRQLEIDRLRMQGATEIEVLEERYQEELRLAGKNQNLQLIAQMKFENKRLEMDQAARKKAEEEAQEAAREEQERAKQRQAFILDNLEFDLNQQRDSISKELDLLNLRYEREFRLRELNELEITELVRRQAIERQAILERSTNQALDKIEDLFAGAATSTTAQAFSNILDRQVEFQLRDLDARHKNDIQKIRESNQEAVEIDKQLTETMQSYAQQREQIRKQEAAMIPKLISQTLAGLAKEAGVEALMNFARAAASLFVDPAASAGYAKAGALMSAAAITAGYASYQVAGSAYVPPMMNTGGGATSPTGSPQTATPERQRAETTATVYNINFGNSVIYDTRRAAQDAFADQIIQTMNRRRRGSPEFRRF